MAKVLDSWRVNIYIRTRQGLRYCLRTLSWHKSAAIVVATAIIFPAIVTGQISSKAYRALGQADLTRNGLNRVQGTEMASPGSVSIDFREGRLRLYVADTGNHRVLAWADAQSYQVGDPPALVLGQPRPDGSAPLGVGRAGLRSPVGIAVDPLTGNLYVADSGNHRVVRFPDPFNNPSRVEPDLVYGQADFNVQTPNGSGNVRNSLRNPLGVTVDRTGNLWVADTGNNRVLRYAAGVLESSFPVADVVLGQKDFIDVGRNRSGSIVSPSGFDTPSALTFDSNNNLYVSDSGNARILRFAAPFVSDAAASLIIGLPTLNRLTAVSFGLAVHDGKLYVAVPKENRILIYSLSASAAPEPVSVLGQPDLNSRDVNAGVYPRAAAYSLMDVSDVKVDPGGNVYVADTGNHRVLRFASGARSADMAWGQLDLTSNGVNQVKATGMNSPSKIVIDYSQPPYALYVSDTQNHRILFWKDSTRFQTGDPADGVIGQPDLITAIANGNSSSRRPSQTSLSGPRGIAVDSYGNLYAADSGNNRVLRFPRPVAQTGIITADTVIGQPDFNTGAAGGVGAATLRSPSSVALGPDENIFVADTGNNRVLEYAAGAGINAAALRVYGQPNFASAVGPRAVSAQTLTQPSGIAVDPAFNLYVSDSGANRIVIFANTRDSAAMSNAASIVIGSDRFDSSISGAARNRLNGPSDVGLDSVGRIYVADTGNSRVLIFPSLLFLPIADAAASSVIGQGDFTSNTVNWNSQDGSATADALFAPRGIFMDRRDTLYVADAGNHRIAHFLKAARIYHGAYPQASALGRGALATIEGEELAQAESSNVGPLSGSLAEREVVVDDVLRAPLISVSPTAINLQLPTTSPTGSARLAVRVSETGELIAGSQVAVASYAPGLFARVLNQDGTTNSESVPAGRGTTIRITGTGQGPVSPSIADGDMAPEGAINTVAVPTTDGNTCLTRQPSVCIAVGNTFGEVRFSGLAAGMVGVWQLDVRIPETAPTGNVPVRVVINAVPSNIIIVAIR